MIEHIEAIVSVLKADATLTDLLDGTATDSRIIPADSFQQERFPCLLYRQVGGGFNTVPRDTAEMDIEFGIFSITSKMNVEDIYKRLNELLNYIVSENPIIIYGIETMSRDANATDRKLFGKIIKFKFYIRKIN